MQGAVVLFAHGARDPQWAVPLARLRQAIEGAAPGIAVRVAYLDLQEPGLAEVLDELARGGAPCVSIAPIFWSRGGHVTRDLPAQLEQWRLRNPGLPVAVLPALCDLPDMDRFLAGAILTLARASA